MQVIVKNKKKPFQEVQNKTNRSRIERESENSPGSEAHRGGGGRSPFRDSTLCRPKENHPAMYYFEISIFDEGS